MRITVLFHFKTDPHPIAVTGVEGQVTDLLLPVPGDLVNHKDAQGRRFVGRVMERVFSYEIPPGPDVSGEVTVTVFLERVSVH